MNVRLGKLLGKIALGVILIIPFRALGAFAPPVADDAFTHPSNIQRYPEMAGKAVESVVEDDLGRYWISTRNEGVWRYDGLRFVQSGLEREVIRELKERGVLAEDAVPDDDPLCWLIEDGECGSLVEAAYRYAAYTPGVTTVMCGTIDRGELEQDIAFMEKGPLPERTLRRLKETFGHIAEPIGN